MKKNAFTLAELLGVITLLGLLALIVLPIVDKNLKEGKEEIYQSQIKSIETAAKMWGTDHVEELPNAQEEKTITLEQLQQDGYLKENMENPKTGKPFDKNMKIKITGHGTYFSYQVLEQ